MSSVEIIPNVLQRTVDSTSRRFAAVTETTVKRNMPETTALPPTTLGLRESTVSVLAGSTEEHFRTYKIRWFGLVILTLLNIMVSWSWLTFAPVASNAAQFYQVDESMVNWFSSIFVFANFVMTPVTIKFLDVGLRPTITAGSLLLLIGSWIRYAGSFSTNNTTVSVVCVAQALLGMSQSLLLSAPTRFSETWFTDSARVSTTAVMSLANPAGAAVGQVVIPFWVSSSDDVATSVLYTAIISSVVAVLGLVVPGRPPTTPGRCIRAERLPIRQSVRILSTSPEIYMIIPPFWGFTGLFIGATSLINQIVSPYGFSDTEAGIGGGLLIILGLISAGIAAPVVDRTKKFLLVLKSGVVLGALCYLALIWIPDSRSVPALYTLLGLLGIASLSIVPISLEVLAELSFPVGVEMTSTVAWGGGQLLGGCFILLGNAMKASADAEVPHNLRDYTIFQAVLALVLVPLPLALGKFGRGHKVVLRRTHGD